MDASGIWGQVMAQTVALFMPHHHRPELAPQQLGKLGAGFVDFFLRGLVLAAGNRAPPRLQAGCFSVTDDSVDVAGLDQAAQRRQFVKLVALRREAGGTGFNNFADSIGRFGIYLTSPPVFTNLFPPCHPRIICGLALLTSSFPSCPSAWVS